MLGAFSFGRSPVYFSRRIRETLVLDGAEMLDSTLAVGIKNRWGVHQERSAQGIKRRVHGHVIIGLAVLSLAWNTLFSPALAQSANPDLIDGAKKEGALVWYTTTSVPEAK